MSTAPASPPTPAAPPITPPHRTTGDQTRRPCPLCAAPAPPARAAPDDMTACHDCGLLYRPRLPRQDESRRWTGYLADEREQAYDRLRRPFFRQYWRLLRRLRGPVAATPAPALLDVGCVPGMLLEPARADGWRTDGVELTDELCDLTRDRTGARMWRGHVETIDFGPRRFDLVTFNDVLRHVTSPRAALARCAAVLRPGGAVAVRETHARRRLARLHPADLQLLTPATATAFLMDAGLERVSVHRSPVSLLTLPRVSRVARSAPRLYEALLECVNRPLARPATALPLDTPSFVTIGFRGPC